MPSRSAGHIAHDGGSAPKAPVHVGGSAPKPPWAAILAVAAISASSAVSKVAVAAGPGAPLDRLEPAPAADPFFAVPSADVTGGLRLGASFAWSYAHDPLVLSSTRPGGKEVAWVDHQLVLHTLLSLEVARRLKLELDVPVTLHQGGESGTVGGTSVVAPRAASFNDVRAGARVALLKQSGLVPAAALSFTVWLPSGDPSQFSGSASARFAPAITLGADYGRWLWTVNVGRRLQPESSDLLIGSQTFGGAAAAVRFAGFQVGPELFFSADAGDSPTKIATRSVGAEGLLAARYAFGPFVAGLGGGPGFARSVGTPTYRLFASIAYSIDFMPGLGGGDDGRSKDGERAAKPPPAKPPPAAPPDRDGDTVPDAEDACPTIVGDARRDAPRRGCPPDRDRDGIFDVDDRCPDVPGVASADPEKNGCPADTDGDGILDADDACPRERGVATKDPRTHGCPPAVRIEGSQIVILQQVNFETGKDEIKQDSFDLLGQVAAVMKDHPEIARVAVDGHTDNVGAEKANINLSQRRALAVLKWLTDHGVDARRLEARGFGPRRPIADNKSDAARAKNRRVEFQIRKRTPDGEAGWRDGPID